MTIQGQVIQVLPTVQGTGKDGKLWARQTFIVEVPGQYPKRIAFDVMNDKIAQFGVQQGQQLSVDFDIDAHEFNGKWFNSIRAWRVQQAGAPMAQQPASVFTPQQAVPQQTYVPQQPPVAAPQQPAPQPNDLPF